MAEGALRGPDSAHLGPQEGKDQDMVSHRSSVLPVLAVGATTCRGSRGLGRSGQNHVSPVSPLGHATTARQVCRVADPRRLR